MPCESIPLRLSDIKESTKSYVCYLDKPNFKQTPSQNFLRFCSFILISIKYLPYLFPIKYEIYTQYCFAVLYKLVRNSV